MSLPQAIAAAALLAFALAGCISSSSPSAPPTTVVVPVR